MRRLTELLSELTDVWLLVVCDGVRRDVMGELPVTPCFLRTMRSWARMRHRSS